jgi:hypothetical protein
MAERRPRTVMVRLGNVAASRRSTLGFRSRRSVAALLLLAALCPATAVAQGPPQPVFTELFAYDPAAPWQLLRQWRISNQLESNLQPLRVGVVEDFSGKTVGRVTVQEGDGIDQAILVTGRYVCNKEGSRAAEMETEWYRFSFKIPGDWPQDVPAAGRQLCRTVIHQIKQDSFKDGKSCDASPFFKIEARPLGERVRFFALIAGPVSSGETRRALISLCRDHPFRP